MFSNSGLSMVNISSRYREGPLNMSVRPNPLDMWRWYVTSLSIYWNKSAMSEEPVYTFLYRIYATKLHMCIQGRKIKFHITRHNSSIYTSHVFLLVNNPALSEQQRYVFGSLSKHWLIRDKTFALISSCDHEVYKKLKKSERKLKNPERCTVTTFPWPRKSFWWPK